jgi:two-component system, NtrC family, sensor kinase
MKVALKLTIAVMAVMAVLLFIHSILVVDREIELFENDMEKHAGIIGNALLAMAPEFLRHGNEQAFADIINAVNEVEPYLHIRVVNIRESSPDLPGLHLEDTTLDNLRRGEKAMHRGTGENNQEYLFAYFPVRMDHTQNIAIEVAESLTPMRQYIRITIIRKIILFLAVVILGSLLVLWLGARIVGASVNNMVQLTNRVSEGDFDDSLEVKNKNDEMATLASGLVEMVRHLKTSKERLDEETTQKLEALEQLHHAERLATVGKLASGLAHELGTPLNVVSGRAKMVSSGELKPEEVIESAQIIDEQSEKMTRIIRQLLDFARIRKPEKKSVVIGELINKGLLLLKPIAASRHVEFKVAESEGLPAVNLDPGQIQQVLTNLIMNAIHAMPDGGIIKISASVEEAKPPADIGHKVGKYLRLEIIDNGVGIPGENLSQIFTPFFSTKEVGKGTGLGLSISHGIISEHKGWIAVTSEPGKGSNFSIYIPLKDD